MLKADNILGTRLHHSNWYNEVVETVGRGGPSHKLGSCGQRPSIVVRYLPCDMVVRMRKLIATHHGADEMHETLVFKPFSCHYDGSSFHGRSCDMQ